MMDIGKTFLVKKSVISVIIIKKYTDPKKAKEATCF